MDEQFRQRRREWSWVLIALLLLPVTIAISFIIGLIKNPEDVAPLAIVLMLLFLGVPAVTIPYIIKHWIIKSEDEK